MKPLWILLALAAAAAIALLLITDHAVGLAISRKQNFEKVQKSDESVNEGWARYQETMRQGSAWLKALDGEKLKMRSRDGLILSAKLCRHTQQPPRGVLLLSHGYRSSVYRDFSCGAKALFDAGYDLLLIHQRAQGESEGEFICFGQKEAEDLADWSRSLETFYKPEVPFYLYGVSMGATAVMLALGESCSQRIRAVVADCGFTSPEPIIRHMIKKVLHLPAFSLYPLADRAFRRKTGCSFGVSTILVLKQSDMPLLLIHGRKDRFVHPWMSEQNYAASASSDKRLCMVDDANHGQSFAASPERVKREILDFLQTHE